MLHAVADHVTAHEANEDCHSETCQNVRTLKAKGMLQTATLPNFEIGHDIHRYANGGAGSIEEQQPR